MNKAKAYLWLIRDRDFGNGEAALRSILEILQGTETVEESVILGCKEEDYDRVITPQSLKLGDRLVELSTIQAVFIHRRNDFYKKVQTVPRDMEIIETTGDAWKKSLKELLGGQLAPEEIRGALEKYRNWYRQQTLSFAVGRISHRAITGLATVRMIVDALNERAECKDYTGIRELIKDLRKDWKANPGHLPSHYLEEAQGLLVGPVRQTNGRQDAATVGGAEGRWTYEESLEGALGRQCPAGVRGQLQPALDALAECAGLRRGDGGTWTASATSPAHTYLRGLELFARSPFQITLPWIRHQVIGSDFDVVCEWLEHLAGDDAATKESYLERFDFGTWLKNMDKSLYELQHAAHLAMQEHDRLQG